MNQKDLSELLPKSFILVSSDYKPFLHTGPGDQTSLDVFFHENGLPFSHPTPQPRHVKNTRDCSHIQGVLVRYSCSSGNGAVDLSGASLICFVCIIRLEAHLVLGDLTVVLVEDDLKSVLEILLKASRLAKISLYHSFYETKKT